MREATGVCVIFEHPFRALVPTQSVRCVGCRTGAPDAWTRVREQLTLTRSSNATLQTRVFTATSGISQKSSLTIGCYARRSESGKSKGGGALKAGQFKGWPTCTNHEFCERGHTPNKYARSRD